jgi:hypothetical protein
MNIYKLYTGLYSFADFYVSPATLLNLKAVTNC